MIRGVVAFVLLVGPTAVQVRTTTLLNEVTTGPSPSVAEEQLEKEGIREAEVVKVLAKELPSALDQEKNIEAIWLLAKLAGKLRITAAIPALCKRLSGNTKYYSSTFYQAAQLTDDPVALALSQMGDAAVQPVSRVLLCPEPSVRIRAYRVLGKIDTPQSLQVLAAAKRQEKDPSVLSVLTVIPSS